MKSNIAENCLVAYLNDDMGVTIDQNILSKTKEKTANIGKYQDRYLFAIKNDNTHTHCKFDAVYCFQEEN